MAWVSVWSKMQTCIRSSWCHCHPSSLAPAKSTMFYHFWYRLTWVVPDKGPLNGCVCVCVISEWNICMFGDWWTAISFQYFIINFFLLVLVSETNCWLQYCYITVHPSIFLYSVKMNKPEIWSELLLMPVGSCRHSDEWWHCQWRWVSLITFL